MKLHRTFAAAAVCAGVLLTAPGLAAGVEGYTTNDTGSVTDTTPAPGQRVRIHVRSLLPGSALRVMLRSDPIFLGTFTADANGEVNVDVTIPVSAPAGSHHIESTGVGADGNPVISSIPITVTAPAAPTSPGTSVISLLPRTGGDVAALLTVGGVLVAVGGASAVAARRRLAESR